MSNSSSSILKAENSYCNKFGFIKIYIDLISWLSITKSYSSCKIKKSFLFLQKNILTNKKIINVTEAF